MFSLILKQLRTESGLSQAELAKEIGVVQGTIYFWENGTNEPTATYLIRLAKFFKIDIEQLLGLEHIETEHTNHLEVLKLYNQMSLKQKNLTLDIMKVIINQK